MLKTKTAALLFVHMQSTFLLAIVRTSPRVSPAFCQLSNIILKNQSVCCLVSSDQVAFGGDVNPCHSLAVPWPFSCQMTTAPHLT